MSQILSAFNDFKIPAVMEARWMAPSNIAFVKYWGKLAHQIPANPSLSLTLNRSYSETHLICSPSESLEVSFKFEGKENEKFALKVKSFLESLSKDWNWIQTLRFDITSSNTFPHSAGIASSASGMAAFSLCLLDIIYKSLDLEKDNLFYIRASHLARLASGSACRSLYGGFVEWGQDSINSSLSDTHATAMNDKIHPEFRHLQDAILIIESAEKAVSSREGHGRMEEHPFAQARFVQARRHFNELLKGLEAGDWKCVGPILEKEALTLHAMMMTSKEPYILIKPQTLELMDLIRRFREESQLPVYFTLDAGPNLHVIYPESIKEKVRTFLENEARRLCESIIFDEEGTGPKSC